MGEEPDTSSPIAGDLPAKPNLDEHASEILENLVNTTMEDWKPLNLGDTAWRNEAVDKIVFKVHSKFTDRSKDAYLRPESLYMAVALLDRYTSAVQVQEEEYYSVAFAALVMAAKNDQAHHPSLFKLLHRVEESLQPYLIADDFEEANDSQSRREEAIRKSTIAMEASIFEVLERRFFPTVYEFLCRLELQNWGPAGASGEENSVAHYISMWALKSGAARAEKPSVIASAALYLSNWVFQRAELWPSSMERLSHLNETEVHRVAEELYPCVDTSDKYVWKNKDFRQALSKTRKQWKMIDSTTSTSKSK